MEEELTLESIKEMIQEYSNKKALFTDNDILSKIEDNRIKINKMIYEDKEEGNNHRIVELLKMCSLELEEMKDKKNHLEVNECMKCLNYLEKLRTDIESIKIGNEDLGFRVRNFKILLIPLLGILFSCYYKYIYKKEM